MSSAVATCCLCCLPRAVVDKNVKDTIMRAVGVNMTILMNYCSNLLPQKACVADL